MPGHVARRALAAEHHAEQVDAHHAMEIRQLVVEEARERRAGDAGIVEHHVQAAATLHGEVDQRLHLVGVRDVGALEQRPAAERGRECLPARLVEVRDHDLRALAHEELHRGAADAARAAGHDGDFPREFLSHPVLLFGCR